MIAKYTDTFARYTDTCLCVGASPQAPDGGRRSCQWCVPVLCGFVSCADCLSIRGMPGRSADCLLGIWQAKRKGVCLLVDVVCHEGEARDAYLRRATADVDQNWACLEPERKVTVKAHITSVCPPCCCCARRRGEPQCWDTHARPALWLQRQ